MTEKCCAQIRTNPGSQNRWHAAYKDCGKTAKVERDGKWYCGVHDPVPRQDKRRAKYAAWDAKFGREDRERRAKDAALAAIRQIADGHNDPVALAREVLAILEGGAK